MTTGAAVDDRLGELLSAAAPGHYRGGPPPADAVLLAGFQDAEGVRRMLDRVCRATGSSQRDAAGFSLFYGGAGAVLGPAAAALLDPSLPVPALDPERTWLGLDAEGLVDAVWPSWLPPVRRSPDPVQDVVGSLVPQLVATVAAFRPHLRVGARGYAAAAGGTLATLAERIGRSAGRVLPARAAVAELVDRAFPLLHPPRYTPVPLGPGRCTAPEPTVCCRFYRVTGGEAFCAGCPRQPEPARTAGFHEYLDRTLRPAVDDLPEGR